MNNNFLKIGLSFVAGIVVGGFVAKKYIESQYEVIEECDDEDITNEPNNDNEIEETEKVEEVVAAATEKVNYNKIKSVNDDEYNRLLNELKYSVDAEAEMVKSLKNKSSEETVVDMSRPYNISQDEFEDVDGYESDEYTYYADGYVTDSYGMPISEEDIDNTIGEDFAKNFGSYSDDQIWIRNERLKMDFSVIRDVDNFVDVAPPRIRRMAGI